MNSILMALLANAPPKPAWFESRVEHKPKVNWPPTGIPERVVRMVNLAVVEKEEYEAGDRFEGVPVTLDEHLLVKSLLETMDEYLKEKRELEDRAMMASEAEWPWAWAKAVIEHGVAIGAIKQGGGPGLLVPKGSVR